MSADTAVPVGYCILVLALAAIWPIVLRSRIRLANIAIASLLAGPIFICCAAFQILLVPLPSSPYNPIGAMGYLIILATVIVIGALIAVPATLIGTAAMIRIGDHATWARHPAAWGLAGSITASTPFIVSGLIADDNAGLVPAFAITGACCALVCRRRVSWERQAISTP